MSLRIVFMGTPEFAVASLKRLQEDGHEIVGVITSVDKWGGRGKNKLIESAVKKYAIEHDLPILQPTNLKNKEFNEELRVLNADLQIVVAFRMLPEMVWNMPPLGTLNLHGSLLPRYRGAAPINWAIINGDKKTGVTTFLLKHEIDTGDILLQEEMPIGADETAGDIHDRMMLLGARVVSDSVGLIESGDYNPQKQDESLVSKAPKIYHEDCEVNFYQTALKVHNLIRGLSPYPTAWCILDDEKLKIFKAQTIHEGHDLSPGTMITDHKSYIRFACKKGYIDLLEIQMQGRKRMPIADFLNGYKFKSPSVHTIDLHFQDADHTIASFAVPSEEGLILIECGPYSTVDALEEGLNKIGYSSADVKHVLLSHIHFDHAGASWYLASKGATIYLHPFGYKHMQNPEALWNSASRIYGDQMIPLWGEMRPIDEDKLQSVEHGEKIIIGQKEFTAWHTPGHAVHHIAWQLGTTLFTGDVAGVSIENGPVVPPCPPPDINLEDWFDSIDLILSLDVNQLFLTHFGVVNRPERHFSELKKVLQDWANWIKDSLSENWDNNERTSKFTQYAKQSLIEKGVDEELCAKYEKANPSWMSVAGLIRYWKKKTPD